MREFNLKLDSKFLQGLRRTSDNTRRSGALVECHNIKPMENGFRLHAEISSLNISATCGDWDITWPWPQVFYGEYYTIGVAVVDLADDCATGLPGYNNHLVLFEMTESDGTWTAEALLDLAAPTYVDQISIIDFGLFYIVNLYADISGTPALSSYARIPGAVTSPYFTSLETASAPKSITGCNFKGQAVLGGIYHSGISWNHLGLADVTWSNIGAFDFRPDHTGNVAGWRRMPWENNGQGMIFKTHAMEKGVMVLGNGGIATLIPGGSDQVVTFGLQEQAGAGIYSGNHAAGDSHILCYIDTNYDLWLVDESFKFQRLGYREYMQELLSYSPGAGDGRTIMSYIPEQRCFYISNGNACYVLSEAGLYSTDQYPTSAGMYQGTLGGFILDGADHEFRLTTDRLNYNTQGLKTLEGFEAGIDYSLTNGELYGSVNYIYDYDKGFESFDWIPINNLGQVKIRITAREFQLKLKGTNYKNATFGLDSIIAQVKFPDRRNRRGEM